MASTTDRENVVHIERKDLQISEEIGTGGFGIVFRAKWFREFKIIEVAVKVIHVTNKNELEIMSKLDHPNIVKMYGVIDEPRLFMLVLELCTGGNLRSYLDNHKEPLPTNLFNTWSQQAAMAIEYLHDNGIIHGDIKSANYLISSNNMLKLTDFGISTMGNFTTTYGEGTMLYLAPEVIRDKIQSPKRDIFALGIVLWELLTRDTPHKGLDVMQVIWNVGMKGLRLSIPADCPEYLSTLIQQCLAENHNERPNIQDVLIDLKKKTTKNKKPECAGEKEAFPSKIQGVYPSELQAEMHGKIQDMSEEWGKFVRPPPHAHYQIPRECTLFNEIPFSNLQFHANIGNGQFSEVYHVTFERMYKGNTEAAAKKLLIASTKEIRILGSVSHQHIATVFGIAYNHPIIYLVLELAPFGSLHDYLTTSKLQPVPKDLVYKWLKESALAIEYLHGNNILHMDIKPQNCLLFHNYTLKLCDFGLASRLTNQGLTQATFKGTWRYCAPEIINPSEGIGRSYSKASDIFAYGVLIFEICTREVPFSDMGFFQFLMQTLEQGPLQPEMPENFPPDLMVLMKRCWQVDFSERPSIGKVLEELIYLDLERATREGLMSTNLNVPSVYHEKSEMISNQGGQITVHDTGVVLKVPQGVIPEGEPVEITVSVHWDREFHPLSLQNGFVIGPALQFKPEGLAFKKPVTITLPHSTENVTAKDLCIWSKTAQVNQNQWHIIWNGNRHGDEISEHENATVFVDGDKIKLRVYHFTKFSAWLRSWLWSSEGGSSEPQHTTDLKPVRKMSILSFMHPPLLTSSWVFIKVYVVRQDEVKNVIDKEKADKFYQCAVERRLTMNLSEENAADMHFIVKPLDDAWEPPEVKKKIEYTALQLGEMDCMCFMYLTKKPQHKNTREIVGTIEIYREKSRKSEETGDKEQDVELKRIDEIPFSNTQCDIPQEAPPSADFVAPFQAMSIAEEPSPREAAAEAFETHSIAMSIEESSPCEAAAEALETHSIATSEEGGNSRIRTRKEPVNVDVNVNLNATDQAQTVGEAIIGIINYGSTGTVTIKNVTKPGNDKELFQKSLIGKLEHAGLKLHLDYVIPDDMSLKGESEIGVKVGDQCKKVLVFSGEQRMSKKFGKAFIKRGKENVELVSNDLLQCVTKTDEEGLHRDYPSMSCFIQEAQLQVVEGSGTEFKNFQGGDIEQQIIDEMPKYVSGFANCKGGVIYFGVEDNRDVTGFKPSQTFEDFQERVFGKLKASLVFIQRTKGQYKQIEVANNFHFQLLTRDVMQRLKKESRLGEEDIGKTDMPRSKSEETGKKRPKKNPSSKLARPGDKDAEEISIAEGTSAKKPEEKVSEKASISLAVPGGKSGKLTGKDSAIPSNAGDKYKSKDPKKRSGITKIERTHVEFRKTDKKVYLLRVPPLREGIVFKSGPTCPLYDPTEKKTKEATTEEWCALLDQYVSKSNSY